MLAAGNVLNKAIAAVKREKKRYSGRAGLYCGCARAKMEILAKKL